MQVCRRGQIPFGEADVSIHLHRTIRCEVAIVSAGICFFSFGVGLDARSRAARGWFFEQFSLLPQTDASNSIAVLQSSAMHLIFSRDGRLCVATTRVSSSRMCLQLPSAYHGL